MKIKARLTPDSLSIQSVGLFKNPKTGKIMAKATLNVLNADGEAVTTMAITENASPALKTAITNLFKDQLDAIKADENLDTSELKDTIP